MSVGPSQFDRFIATVRAELVSIKDSIQEQLSAIHDEQETNRNEQKEAQDRIQLRLSEIAISPKEKDKANTYRKRYFAVQVALTLFTFGAFISAAIYAGYAARQLREMKNTYEEMRNQTKAAQEANEMTHALIAPVLRIEGSPALEGDRGMIVIQLRNIGKTSARDVLVEGTVTEQSLTGGSKSSKSVQVRFDVIPPDQETEGGIVLPMPQHNLAPNLAEEYFLPPEWKEKVIYLNVTVGYDAGLKDRQSQKWCRAIIGEWRPSANQGMMLAPEPHLCGNDVDYWIHLRRKNLKKQAAIENPITEYTH